MEPGDSFDWIEEICQVSSSDDSRERRCSYFFLSDSDDSDSDSGCRNPTDIPFDSAGITMVSPPESPQDERPDDQYSIAEDQEIFHTPPEHNSTTTSFYNCNDDGIIGNGLDHEGETVAVNLDSADSRRAVDLGSDTDLGFSEAEVEVDSTPRIETNSSPDGTFHRGSEEIRVSKREFSPKWQLSTKSPFKRLKGLDLELPSKPLGTPNKRNTDDILKSLKKWKFRSVSLSPEASSELEPENQQNHESDGEVVEGSVRKRSLDFSTEVISSETEERTMERENNNVKVSIRGQSLNFSAEDIECDTEKRNIECEEDSDKENSDRNKKIVEDIDQVRHAAGNGSNSCGMEEKTEKKRVLPSWANNGIVGDDESFNEEMEENEPEVPSWTNNGRVEDDESGVNETELLSSANSSAGDGDERVDEEKEVDEMELPSQANDRVEGDDQADGQRDITDKEEVHMDTGSDSLNENFEEITLFDVLVKLEEDCEDNSSIECLSLLEVAERKWGTFSLGEL